MVALFDYQTGRDNHLGREQIEFILNRGNIGLLCDFTFSRF